MSDKDYSGCEFYDNAYCRCGDTRVPQEIGYSDILCSEYPNCYYKQLQEKTQENTAIKQQYASLIQFCSPKLGYDACLFLAGMDVDKILKLKQNLDTAVEALKCISSGTFKDNNGNIFGTDFAQLKICKEISKTALGKIKGE